MIGNRKIEDALFVQTKALPAANASASTVAFDLVNGPGEMSPERIEFVASVPATPALVDAKTVTVTVEESADGVTFAAQPAVAPLVLTGASGTGAAGGSRRFHLPSTAKRYIRATAAVQSAGGDNTAVSFTLKAKF